MRTSRAMTLGRDGRPRRMENWSATHAGYLLERQDEPGTPWLAILTETGERAGMWPSLPKAKRAIDAGAALQYVQLRRAMHLSELLCSIVGNLPTQG